MGRAELQSGRRDRRFGLPRPLFVVLNFAFIRKQRLLSAVKIVLRLHTAVQYDVVLSRCPSAFIRRALARRQYTYPREEYSGRDRMRSDSKGVRNAVSPAQRNATREKK